MRKYRQSVFKLNYKIKKRRGDLAPEEGEACVRAEPASRQGSMPIIPSTAAARVAASQGLTPGISLCCGICDWQALEDAGAEPASCKLGSRPIILSTAAACVTASQSLTPDDTQVLSLACTASREPKLRLLHCLTSLLRPTI